MSDPRKYVWRDERGKVLRTLVIPGRVGSTRDGPRRDRTDSEFAAKVAELRIERDPHGHVVRDWGPPEPHDPEARIRALEARIAKLEARG